MAESPEQWLLDELDLGSARGGKRPSAGPVEISVLRGMTPEDLDSLAESGPAQALAPLDQLRSSHHQLAQLIAKGHSQAKAGLITGYSDSYISVLVNRDPAFRELLAHYRAEREEVFVDVLERMKVLGLEVNDLILQRIRQDPEKWTNQQIMDLHKETMGAMVKGSAVAVGGGLQIGKLEVSFVTPSGGGGGVVIEGSSVEIQEE